MEVLNMIEQAEHAGCELVAEGEHIRIKKGKRLSASLKAEIREHKADILAVLTNDSKAKAAGFMIGVPGELYTLSLSKSSAVYIEQIGGGWQAWRETYQKGREQAVSTKTIVKASTLDYVLMKVKGYFAYIERKRGAKHGK